MQAQNKLCSCSKHVTTYNILPKKPYRNNYVTFDVRKHMGDITVLNRKGTQCTRTERTYKQVF